MSDLMKSLHDMTPEQLAASEAMRLNIENQRLRTDLKALHTALRNRQHGTMRSMPHEVQKAYDAAGGTLRDLDRTPPHLLLRPDYFYVDEWEHTWPVSMLHEVVQDCCRDHPDTPLRVNTLYAGPPRYAVLVRTPESGFEDSRIEWYATLEEARVHLDANLRAADAHDEAQA